MSKHLRRARQPEKVIGCVLRPELFKALCDPTRIGLLAGLTGRCKPQSVSEIAGCCTCDMSVVSRHLAILRDAGVLAARRQGRRVYYTVRFEALIGTLRALADALERCDSCRPPRRRPSSAPAKERRGSSHE